MTEAIPPPARGGGPRVVEGAIFQLYRSEQLADSRDQRFGDLLVDDQPAQRRATLPGGPGGGEQDRARGELKVGRRRDDHRIVAAKLEQ